MKTQDLQRTARLAGALYLAVALLAPIGEMVIRGPMIVPSDAAATTANISASEGLYRLGFVIDLITQIFQVFLVLALFRLFIAVDKRLTLSMSVLGWVAVPITMVVEVTQLVPLLLLGSPGFLAGIPQEHIQGWVALSLELRALALPIVYTFWGLWLLPLGRLLLKSKYVPKLFGILMLIAGSGYLVDFGFFYLLPDAGLSIKAFTFWGEVLLPLWLLIKGIKEGPEEPTR